MKLTNQEIRTYLFTYREVIDEKVNMKFTTLFKIRKNIQRLEEVNRAIDATIQEVVDKYQGTPDFESQLGSLNFVENEVDIEMIPLSEFEDVVCSNKFINAIYFMVE